MYGQMNEPPGARARVALTLWQTDLCCVLGFEGLCGLGFSVLRFRVCVLLQNFRVSGFGLEVFG